MRQKYVVRPLSSGMLTDIPSVYLPGSYSPSELNIRIKQSSIQKRPGYTLDRTLNAAILGIVLYQQSDGDRYTLYLTETDLARRESTGTYSFKTETYTTGSVTNITGATVTGNATGWDTSGIAAGDKFILDADHTAASELDAQWAQVLTVDGATQITLTATYGGTTGALPPDSTYKARKPYTVPANERWAWAIVDDNFYFSNGNTDVQKWTGAGYASAVDSTNAKQARHCIEYADRLVLADLWNVGAGARDPYLIQWSKNLDPTNWVDSTAGSAAFLDTDDMITGLGKVGANLVVYKRDNIIIGNRTGTATSPIEFPVTRRGKGCVAPYSILEILGTNVFLGRDDFYMIDGDYPRPLSKEKMRWKFFDIVSTTQAERTWAGHNSILSEAYWVTDTDDGRSCFVWNYLNDEWYMYMFTDEMLAFGRGEV